MYIRKWLEDEKSDVNSYVVVSGQSFGKDIDAYVKIADCNRSINLNFGCYSIGSGADKHRRNELKKRQKKLKIVIDALNKLYEFLNEQIKAE